MKLKTLGFLAVAVTGMVFTSSWAGASSIEVTNGLTVTPVSLGGGLFSYTYDLVLTPLNGITGAENFSSGTDQTNAVGPTASTGSIINIDGLSGVTGASFLNDVGAVGEGVWTYQPTQTSPPFVEQSNGLNTQGNLGGMNVLFTYGGPLFQNSSTTTNLALGTLTIISTDGTVASGLQYYARDIQGTADSAPSQINTDTVNGPVAVPVPAAAWTGFSTLALVAGLGLIRRRRLA